MARSKSYKREEAIEKAKYAFWEHGYHTLGIRAIEDLTGLGRFAIRTDFGGKEGLLLEALADYAEWTRTYIIKPLEKRNDLTALEEALEVMVSSRADAAQSNGCLLVNTWVEASTLKSGTLAETTMGYFGETKTAVEQLVSRSIDAGETRPDVDVTQAADYFFGCQVAINLINRGANDMTAASGFVETAKSAIRSWRV